MSPHQPQLPELLPAIRRARIDRLNIYEISEAELQVLEHGSPESLFLNFAIFLLSSASSLLVTLLTTKIESERLFYVFVIVTVIGFIAGLVLMFLWRRNRQSTSLVFAEIRRRMPPEGAPLQVHEVIDIPPPEGGA
jgi:Na+/melibiose symporter-like transporter